MNKEPSIKLAILSGVATLTLNRPQVRNAFDETLIQLFTQHLKQIAEDSTITVVLLRGEGEHFCSGADIRWMQKTSQGSEKDNKKDALALAQLLHTFNHLNKPTIAITQGAVFGGGVGLVACADIAIATNNTTFCFSEVKLGLVPAVISPYVIAAIGERACRRYMLTAEVFGAHEAQALGLVHEVVSIETLEKKLSSLIQAIRHNGPHAVQTTKKLIHSLTEELIPTEKMEYTTHLIAKIRTSEEAQEGFKAFLEKRPAQWLKGDPGTGRSAS